MHFFIMSQGSFNRKIRFLDQNVCPVARLRMNGWTHTHIHKSEYRGHPFRVSRHVPSTYHQRSAQLTIEKGMIFNIGPYGDPP